MDYKTMYEVTRPEYEHFVRSLKPEIREVLTDEHDDFMTVKILRKSTKECLCERESFKDDREEKYYIYLLPNHDETVEVQPRRTVILQTPEQVQKLLQYLSEVKQGE